MSARISTPGGAFDAVGVLRKNAELYLQLELAQDQIFRQREELSWYALVDYLFSDLINRVTPYAGSTLFEASLRAAQDQSLALWVERFYEQWESQWPRLAAYQHQVSASKVNADYVNLSPWTVRVQREVRADIRKRVTLMFATNLREWTNFAGQQSEFYQYATASVIRRRKIITTLEITSMLSTAKDWAVAELGYGKFDKIWRTEGDEWVRDSHTKQDELRIDADATFPNGCRFPGDPDAAIEETANCRCICIYVPKENWPESDVIES